MTRPQASGRFRPGIVLRLILSLLLPQVAGVTGALFTAPAIPGWYAHLEKPFFTPPGGLFGPVWISLYVLMGIALFLLWNAWPKPGTKIAMVLFMTQLLLNALWTPFFFGLRSELLGLADILLLDLVLIWTILYILKVSRTAGFLLIPYALWTGFATILNASIWWLNRT